MPRRRKTAAQEATSTPRRSPRTRRATSVDEGPARSEEEIYAEIVEVRADMLKRICAGYGRLGAREELAQVRVRAQELADRYPTLWERACISERADKTS